MLVHGIWRNFRKIKTSVKFSGDFPINFRKVSGDNVEILRNLEYFRLILLTFWDTELKFRSILEETEKKIENYFKKILEKLWENEIICYELMLLTLRRNSRKLERNNFMQISEKFWRNIQIKKNLVKHEKMLEKWNFFGISVALWKKIRKS